MFCCSNVFPLICEIVTRKLSDVLQVLGLGSTSVWSDLILLIVKGVKSRFFWVLTLLSGAPYRCTTGDGSIGQELSKTVYNWSVAPFVAAL